MNESIRATDDAAAVEGEISLDREGQIGILTINRPKKHNAMTVAMMDQLWALTRQLQEDDAIRAIVLTGAGERAFCAGGDLTELLPRLVDDGDTSVISADPSERFFSRVDKPVIAAVNGLCIAGGFEMLLGTDIRVAAEGAVFGLAEVKWGIVPGAGSMVRLPQQIGWAPAMEIMLTGDTIDADRAFALGIVNCVVPAPEVMTVAMEYARRIAANGPIAVRTVKRVAAQTADLDRAFRMEADLTTEVLKSEDIRAGLRAFAEKTTPKFIGR